MRTARRTAPAPARGEQGSTGSERAGLRRLTRLVLLGLLIGACSMERRTTSPSLVFASILPQKYFIDRVANGDAEVVVMVGPGANPATYEPSPRQMAELSEARAYFRIGVPFENAWIPRITSAYPELRMVDSSAGIRRIDGDPHVWTNPLLVKAIARNLQAAFSAMRPDRRDAYEANSLAFQRDLDALDAEIRAILRPIRNRKFMVFHPSWAYFAAAYGLEQISIEREGKEPGAKRLAQFIAQGKREQIKVIFVQAQFNRRSAETIAQAIGATVVVVDPLAEDYLSNMRDVARAFAAAMEGR